jgi:ABC-type multidrug transport system fused ATPase/permease subunit
MTEKKQMTRSELEIIIKRRAAVLLIVLAALVAINSFFKDGNSGRIMKDIIAANNQWAWYQAKNVRSVIYETAGRHSDAQRMKDDMEQIKYVAQAFEAEQKAMSAKAPYYTYSAMLMQLGLVLSTAAILAVSMPLFYSGVAVGSLGVILFGIALFGV